MAIVYSTAWEIAFSNNDNSMANYTSRMWVDPEALVEDISIPLGQTHVRLRFEASSTTALRIHSAFIGHGFESPAKNWDTSGLTPLLFDGEPDIVIPAGETRMCDTTAFIYDGESPLVISTDTEVSPASGERYTNFDIAGGSGVEVWQMAGAQRADEPTMDDAVGGVNIGLQTGVHMVNRFEWGVDTEASTPIAAVKLTGYAVMYEVTPIDVPKLAGYAVVAEAYPMVSVKMAGYAVMQVGEEGGGAYKYSYLPIIN